MKVGMLLHPVNSWGWDAAGSEPPRPGEMVPDAELWDETKRLGLLAEPLGFDSLFVTEHHRTAYGLSPNPLQVMAYFAGRTSRIGLGTAVVVLPWHDPVRVAEDIALLDHLAGDRTIEVGFGRGAAASEYEHLRVDQATSRERFDESVDVIRAALTQDTFSYDGEIFRIPPTSVRPRPRHTDIVDRFFCAFAGESSLQAAALRGLGMAVIVAKGFDSIQADIERFNAIRLEQGLAPTRPLIVLLLYCAETEAAARDGAIRCMDGYYRDAERHYHWEDIGTVRGYEHYRARTKESFERKLRDHEYLDYSVWGTPDMCVEQVRDLQAKTDLGTLLLNVRYGPMAAEEAERSIRHFADEALPKLRDDTLVEPVMAEEAP